MNRLTTIDPKQVSAQLNKCYLEWDPNYPALLGEPTMMNGFKYYVERTAGMRLDFTTEIKNGKIGYKMNRVDIVDEKKFMLFQIQYSK